MFNNNNGYSLADIAAATGNGGNRNGGDGFGFNGGEGVWILLLFIILLAGGNWGNGNGYGGGNNSGGGGYAVPYFYNNTVNDVQRGFDQQTLTNGIAGVQSGIYGLSTQLCNGFADTQQSLCNGFSGVTAAINSGFANAQTAENTRQMANMQQAFANQTLMNQGFNQISSQFADCCCENRLASADLKYTIATENCADRYEAAQNTRDIIQNCNRNNQVILDKLCQLEIDGIKQNYENRISGLQNALDQARSDNQGLRFIASQTAQTADIQRGQVAEVDALYQRLKDCPVGTMPVYGSQPIFTCPNNNNNGYGCGCGGNF